MLTPDQIKEGNQKIARFMGWIDSPYENTPNKMYKGEKGIFIDTLSYHSSWDCMMSVVEKIESLGFDTTIRTHLPVKQICKIMGKDDNPYISESSDSKKEATWLAIVEFIEWYNG